MKKNIRWLLVSVIITGMALLFVRIVLQKSSESKIAFRIAQLPPAGFTTLLDTPFNLTDLKKSHPLIIIYFSPGCDHCQHSAEELYRYRKDLKQSTIIMIADEAKNEVKAFASRYQIDQMENIILLLDKDDQAQKVLGLNKVPSYLLYDKEQRLIKKFVGEATMDLIIKTFKHRDDAIIKKTS